MKQPFPIPGAHDRAGHPDRRTTAAQYLRHAARDEHLPHADRARDGRRAGAGRRARRAGGVLRAARELEPGRGAAPRAALRLAACRPPRSRSVNEVLGEGEVSIQVAGPASYRDPGERVHRAVAGAATFDAARADLRPALEAAPLPPSRARRRPRGRVADAAGVSPCRPGDELAGAAARDRAQMRHARAAAPGARRQPHAVPA